MADVDEALVEEVETVIGDAMGEMFDLYFSEKPGDFEADLARAVLAYLAATGRLVGEGEERVEWGCRRLKAGGWVVQIHTGERTARAFGTDPGATVVRRTVRTWTTPDGTTGTLVGPWVEVEG